MHSSKDVDALLSNSGNKVCMECDSIGVECVSVNLGVFLCQSCGDRHRKLGAKISRVRSLYLDTNIWTESIINDLKSKGNINAKYYFESRVPLYQVRPPNDMGPAVIEDWIRCKYREQLFIDPNRANNIYYTIPRPIQHSLTSHSDDTKSNNIPNFAIHKMPISPTHIMMKWIVPNVKYQTKTQFIVLHGRFISRYATPSSHKCEQIIDITKQPVWISQSEINQPSVLAIGPENANDSMRLEFETYKDAKYWTELIRRSSLFYTALAKQSCATKPDDTIDSLMSCNVTEFDNTSAYKQLKFGSVKRQQKFSIGWDKKWWSINLKRKILLYFPKDPRTIKPPKKNPLFIQAQGGIYLNEVTADIDNDGYRSGQEHCLLLYNFEKTIFIKFEERWPLIQFWKELHLKGRDVNFIGHHPMYYEKALCQQNVDVQIMLIKQKSPRLMAATENINPMGPMKKDLDGFEMECHSPSSSPDAPSTYEGTLGIQGMGIGSAILHHELLSADAKLAITDNISKPKKMDYEPSITDYPRNEIQQPNPYEYGAKQRQNVSTLAMLMDLHQQTSKTNNDLDFARERNLSYEDEYDMQIDDENDETVLHAAKKRKQTTTATEYEFNDDFGMYSVNTAAYHDPILYNKMTSVSAQNDTKLEKHVSVDSVLYDDPSRYDSTQPAPKEQSQLHPHAQLAAIALKQSNSMRSLSSTMELSGACDLDDEDEDDEEEEQKDTNLKIGSTLLHTKGMPSMDELQFMSDNTPNLPDDDIGSPSSPHLVLNGSTPPAQFNALETKVSGSEMLSEEEDVMYKDHRRGTVQKFADKNKYKSRTYRKFAKSKVLDSIKELKGKDQSHQNEIDEVPPPPPPMPPPPPIQRVQVGKKNQLMRQYLLSTIQSVKLNDADMMQDIMIQVGNMASFFVQPGNKLFVHLHVTTLSQSRRDELWKSVEELLGKKIGTLQLIK